MFGGEVGTMAEPVAIGLAAAAHPRALWAHPSAAWTTDTPAATERHDLDATGDLGRNRRQRLLPQIGGPGLILLIGADMEMLAQALDHLVKNGACHKDAGFHECPALGLGTLLVPQCLNSHFR